MVRTLLYGTEIRVKKNKKINKILDRIRKTNGVTAVIIEYSNKREP